MGGTGLGQRIFDQLHHDLRRHAQSGDRGGAVLHRHQPALALFAFAVLRGEGHVQPGEKRGDFLHAPGFDILDHRAEFGGNFKLLGVAAAAVGAAGLHPDLAQ